MCVCVCVCVYVCMYVYIYIKILNFPGGWVGKNLPAMGEM